MERLKKQWRKAGRGDQDAIAPELNQAINDLKALPSRTELANQLQKAQYRVEAFQKALAALDKVQMPAPLPGLAEWLATLE